MKLYSQFCRCTKKLISQEVGVRAKTRRSDLGGISDDEAQRNETEQIIHYLSCFFYFEKRKKKINNNEEFDPGSG